METIKVNICAQYQTRKAEQATRFAWVIDPDRVASINRVIATYEGKIVCVIENPRIELSTPENNPYHAPDVEGRFVFLDGDCYTDRDAWHKPHPAGALFKKVGGDQGTRFYDVWEYLALIK